MIHFPKMGNMSRWLDVEVGSDDNELTTLPSNIVLLDLQNDNELKLIVGDLGKENSGSKIKVFQGATQVADIVLPDMPLGVVGFYSSETMPKSYPLIAVAFSSCVYVFRNLKLFYKYYLPSAELSTCEMEVWKQLTDSNNHKPETLNSLSDSLKSIPFNFLTPQSQKFISLTSEQQLEYLENSSKLPVRTSTEVTCIATLKFNSVDRYSISCLVVGTEDGDIIILDPQNFTQLYQAKICGVTKTPYQMLTTGLYNVDYRITVATREKCVCLLKREWKEGRVLFNTEEHVIALEVMPADNSVVVICTDNTMACYSKKGKKQWLLTLQHRPVALCTFPLVHLGTTLVGVGLASGHVQLYDGKALVDTMFVRDVVSVMKFGQLGQEEHVLIIVTSSGNLMLKILKRTADFSVHATDSLPQGTSVGRPWLIPKKSKLFLEQSMRERENAVGMHATFQRSLGWLRLHAARSLLETHARADNSVAAGALEPLALSAEVEGLGPVFRVTLSLRNSSPRAALGLALLYHLPHSAYKVYNPYVKIPLLSPNTTLSFPTKVEEVFGQDVSPDVLFRSVTGQGGERAIVKVLLLKNDRSQPVLAATVHMPPTDPMMLPYDKMQQAHHFA